MSHHIPLIVRADLEAGLAYANPWGIALDGILAAQIWETIKPQQPHRRRIIDDPNPPDLDLPLARCTPTAGPWHWAATCSYPDPPNAPTAVSTWTSRTDPRALEQLTTALPRTVSTRQGRYRAYRMPLLITTASAVTWHAVGNPDRIRELLADVVSIGKHRNSGEGHVLAWTVTPCPDLDLYTAAHLHPNQQLGRPTPAACLPVPSPLTLAGIRPPYTHPSRQHRLAVPAGTDS